MAKAKGFNEFLDTDDPDKPEPKRAPIGRPFLPGKEGGPGRGHRKLDPVRGTARQHEREAMDMLISRMRGEGSKDQFQAAVAVLAYARGKPGAATPQLQRGIGQINLRTEKGALEAMRKVATGLAEGSLALDHARTMASIIAACITAERGAMESKVVAALERVQKAIEAVPVPEKKSESGGVISDRK